MIFPQLIENLQEDAFLHHFYGISRKSGLTLSHTVINFQIYESRARIGQENRMVKITVEGVIDDITPYREILNAHSVHLSTYYINYDYAQNRTELNMAVLAPSHRNYLPMFNALRTIRPTLSLTLTATA